MNSNQKAVKMNLFDAVVIILLLIALMASLYSVFFFKLGLSEDKSEITLILKVGKTEAIFSDRPKAGDILYDGKTGSKVGTIKSVVHSECSEFDMQSREYINIPGYISMEIEVEVYGVLGENEGDGKTVKIGTASYRAGSENSFRTNSFYFNAVISVSRTEIAG